MFGDASRAFAIQNPVVLLVDDSLLTARAVGMLLAEHDDIDLHHCLHAADAPARAADLHPTVILQDLLMPGVDGLDVVRMLREQPATRDIPIIVLSSQEEADTKAKAFAAGANDYLVKLPEKVERVARIRYHTKAYMGQLQRDEAYRVLHENQRFLEEANRELTRLYSLDALTGIANRRFFDEVFTREWRRAMRERAPLSVVLIDVDCFKGYNDTYGHQAGDECLRSVASVLASVLKRPADLAARFGGEEFVIMLPATPPEGARMVAEQMRSGVEALDIAHTASVACPRVTISLGLATVVPERTSTAAALITAADQALYMAKREGRNQVRSAPLRG